MLLTPLGPAAFTIGFSASHAQSAQPKLAEEQFKNIQVLKGIPADQLIPTMQFISASLGVECEYCHVEGAFEKDDKKPKQTARKMIEMVFGINKVNFENRREVTCYSCHSGTTQPVGIPSITAYNGSAGWRNVPGRPVQWMSPAEADASRLDADLLLALRMKEMFSDLRVLPAEKIDGHDVNVLQGLREGKPPVTFYLDQQS